MFRGRCLEIADSRSESTQKQDRISLAGFESIHIAGTPINARVISPKRTDPSLPCAAARNTAGIVRRASFLIAG
jgi:hypothetical protein